MLIVIVERWKGANEVGEKGGERVAGFAQSRLVPEVDEKGDDSGTEKLRRGKTV